MTVFSCDPRKLVEFAKFSASILHNSFPPFLQTEQDDYIVTLVISGYGTKN